ncbi:hypothetical protein SMB34_20160 [Thalassospira permensis NBRC 106175]|uniref:Uncharacterized protein n=1 Tax=Thalassospira permensis NBRC 106175 TaxID=1353532 RepID=A0ABR4TLR2_9PROT|nr:hypothetical protein SMB34_20160 [Thalassospira permensis NBRC 106175]
MGTSPPEIPKTGFLVGAERLPRQSKSTDPKAEAPS